VQQFAGQFQKRRSVYRKGEQNMKALGRVTLCLVLVTLLALTANLMSKPVQATNPQGVTVTNTPLPVQGSISIGNTPSVTVANSPSVNIANSSLPITGNVGVSGSVAVTNALNSNNTPIPLSVVQQGQPASDWCEPNPGNNTCSLIAVPAGMRLVIQEVDMSMAAATGANIYTALMTTVLGGKTSYHQFVITSQGTDDFSSPQFAVHQATTLYADAGTQPTCSIAGTGSANVFLRCSYSGYLVPTQ
jgi:hypothetical protein